MINIIINLLLIGRIINISHAEIAEAQLNALAWDLAWCESRQTADIKILDSNNEYSYGMLQFQQKTFDGFGEKYGLLHSDIYSYEQQRDIFKAMYRESIWKKHWVNCSKSVDIK